MAEAALDYPLEQVLEVKRKRVDEQKKVVKQKKEELKNEQEKLKKAEEERDKVQMHHDDKLTQMRAAMDKDGMKPEKILQMKAYLKLVKENLAKEKEKVKEQQERVEQAKKNLEDAKVTLKRKEVEVEKIETHKEIWMAEAKKEIARKEAAEADELGSMAYVKRMREMKGR